MPDHVTKGDLNNLMETIIASFKSETKIITDKLQSLEERIIGFENSITDIKAEQERQALELQELKVKVGKINNDSKRADTFEIIAEVKDHLRRNKNIVIRGVNESPFGSMSERQAHDEEEVEKILEEINVFSAEIDTVTRIGRQQSSMRTGDTSSHRKRLLKVTFADENMKKQALKNAKMLRSSSNFKDVYLNPDRTPFEQQQFSKLRQELKDRRDVGEDVVILRNKVVSRNEANNAQNFQ